MEFGKVAPEKIADIDFTLPADDRYTVLPGRKHKGGTEVYLGCAKWGRKDWVGKLYPQGTREKDYLAAYAQHFNSIELNATFYKIPDKNIVEKWRDAVAEQPFLFCPKFPNTISHILRLKNAGAETERFLEHISLMHASLGPCFLQLSDMFPPKQMETLAAYLRYLPADFPVFVEVRHTSWFSDAAARDEWFALLRETGKGAVITDASGRRDCVHTLMPVPQAFIRFVGNGLHPTDYSRIDAWVERLKTWMDQGLEKLYFFMHQHEELHSPELAQYLVEKMNAVCGTAVEPPRLYKQDSLF